MKVTNLLPRQEQQAIIKQRILSYLQIFNVWSFVTYALVIAVLIGGKFYLQQNLNNLDTDIKKQQAILAKSDNTKIRNEIDKNNNSVRDYVNLVENNPNWAKVLEEFAGRVPDGVLIKDFNANTKTGMISISGVSVTRDAVLQLRQNILASPMFQNIDLPLENIQKPTSVQFHYTFFIKDGILKP